MSEKIADLSFKPHHIEAAKQLQQKYDNLLNSHPVVESARAAVDFNESNAAPLNYDTSSDVGARSRLAMSDLKAQLAGLRSNTSSAFNESVPPSETEARVRGCLQFDSSASDNTPKTTVSVNVRPNNRESFEASRERRLRGLPAMTEDKEEADAVITLRFKLNPGTSDEDVKEIEKTLVFMINEGDEDKECTDFKLTRDGDSAIVTVVLRDENTDPLEELLRDFGSDFLELGRSYGDRAKEFARNAAPQIFRQIVGKLEVPHSLEEFANDDRKSWIKLTEGSRLAFEAILRQDITKKMKETCSIKLLDKWDMEDVRAVAGALTAAGAARDFGINLKVPNVEHLYGMAIRDGSYADRRTREAADLPYSLRRAMRDSGTDRSANASLSMARLFGSTGVGSRTATIFGSVFMMGATGEALRDRIVAELSSVVCEAVEAQEEGEGESLPSLLIAQTMTKAAKCIANFEEINLVSHAFNFNATFEGFTSKIVESVNTPQKIVDRAIPVILAGQCTKEEIKADFEDSEDEQKLEERAGRPRNLFPRGGWEDEIEKITERDLALEDLPCDNMFAIIQRPQPRNTFRVLLYTNQQDEKDMGWAKILSAWGANVFNPSADGAGEDDSDVDSEDMLENPPLPSPDEGYFRAAYVKLADGRFVEFVRPAVDAKGAAGHFGAVDAAVVVDSLREKPVNDLAEIVASWKDEKEEELPVKPIKPIPVLFVSTDGSAASAETTGKITEHLFTPTATKYEAFSESNAAALLNWLFENAENPSKGTGGPVNALDFLREDPLTIP